MNIKRIIALLLASVLAVAGCAAVYAEGVDLSTYSDEELLALLGAVQQEMAARRIERTATLPAGIYIGGRDLPVGGICAYIGFLREQKNRGFVAQEIAG